MTTQIDVIYSRFSTPEAVAANSCENQDTHIRAALGRHGIDLADAYVIEDKSMCGTKSDRVGYERIIQMIRRRQIRLLAVEDLSRLCRSDDALALIKEVVASGGRFISVNEGIDTNAC